MFRSVHFTSFSDAVVHDWSIPLRFPLARTTERRIQHHKSKRPGGRSNGPVRVHVTEPEHPYKRRDDTPWSPLLAFRGALCVPCVWRRVWRVAGGFRRTRPCRHARPPCVTLRDGAGGMCLRFEYARPEYAPCLVQSGARGVYLPIPGFVRVFLLTLPGQHTGEKPSGGIGL